jgi:serine/threonine protein kinase
VLPDLFSGDPERLARFEREAKLLASLNHPNIAAIHGLEEAGGERFLVLELVEGETLAQRIAKGPLPVKSRAKSKHSQYLISYVGKAFSVINGNILL